MCITNVVISHSFYPYLSIVTACRPVWSLLPYGAALGATFLKIRSTSPYYSFFVTLVRASEKYMIRIRINQSMGVCELQLKNRFGNKTTTHE